MQRHPADSCGFGTALNAIGGKWKTAILWEINEQPRRFGELRRRLAGISEKVLNAQLTEMVADGLILRTEYHGSAIRHVEYVVTPWGRSLNEAVGVMARWGKAQQSRMLALGDIGSGDELSSRLVGSAHSGAAG